MPPFKRPDVHACCIRLRALRPSLWLVLAGAASANVAFAAAPPPAIETAAPADDVVRFAADGVTYDHDADIVTARGNVVLRRDARSLRADSVTWNRTTGVIAADGNVRFVDEDGDVLYSGHVDLTDEFKAGTAQDLLLVLREGGRLAAQSSERDAAGHIVLHNAVYSGCDVTDDQGCPRQPSWELSAVRVTYNPVTSKVRYYGAVLRMFGVPLLPLPGLAHASDFRAVSGLLIPSFSLTSSNGAEITNTFYWRLGDTRDVSVTGTVFSRALPMLSGHYRQLTDAGAYQINAYVTRSRQTNATTTGQSVLTAAATGDYVLRGYAEANGRFQLGNDWSVTGSARYVSDRTFLLRYDLTTDTRLRSTINLEHQTQDSYTSLAAWGVQAIGVKDTPATQPFALPAIDWRQRLALPGVGGNLDLGINALALTRSNGQNTQRALARAQWDWHTITPAGQELTLTTLVRGDLYHSTDNALIANPVNRGNPGWQVRGIATAAADIKWPLIGAALGGTQVLTPEVQIVATPHIRNLAIANEDSRAVELEDSSIFALNRYPGYDRVEDGVRVTYGVDWRFNRPGWRASATLAQSYRVSHETALTPPGIGLAARLSDIVGRAQLRFADIVQLTERFQLDKTTLQLRRNEFDATLGNHRTYVEIGYIALNRSIPLTYEDLQDSKELRASGRIGFARYWSIFGSAIANLTTKADDPINGSNGFQLIRHRMGVAYTDDCFDIAFTWRRDYVTSGDAVRGNSFGVTLALRNIGTR